MNNIQKINDIKYLIMEHYSDKEPLNESQEKSKQCFYRYCDDIKKELKEKEKLEKVIEIIKKHFFLENFSDFISINGRLDKTDYNINEINLLKEVFENDDR